MHRPKYRNRYEAGRASLDDSVVRSLGLRAPDLDAVLDRERTELARREAAYRGSRPPVLLTGRPVILVDDGIATGASMRVAALAARESGAAQVVVAVPTAPVSAGAEFSDVADEFVCPHTPRSFVAVGLSYADFRQTSDREVRDLMTG